MQRVKQLFFNIKCWRLCIVLAAAYVTFVLSFVWWHCHRSQLLGGERGPLDAYRHTLASATVSYTVHPILVRLVTAVMERKNSPSNLMDQHNNAIGACIGTQAHSLFELDTLVQKQVAGGAVNASNPKQTTWLPKQYWANNIFW